jgi:hypothetical protein
MYGLKYNYTIFYSRPNFYDAAKTEYDYFLTKYLESKTTDFIKANKNKYLYIYNFSDDRPDMYEAESGKAFFNVPYIRINQH